MKVLLKKKKTKNLEAQKSFLRKNTKIKILKKLIKHLKFNLIAKTPSLKIKTLSIIYKTNLSNF